jgi:hypothetical protein
MSRTCYKATNKSSRYSSHRQTFSCPQLSSILSASALRSLCQVLIDSLSFSFLVGFKSGLTLWYWRIANWSAFSVRLQRIWRMSIPIGFCLVLPHRYYLLMVTGHQMQGIFLRHDEGLVVVTVVLHVSAP